MKNSYLLVVALLIGVAFSVFWIKRGLNNFEDYIIDKQILLGKEALKHFKYNNQVISPRCVFVAEEKGLVDIDKCLDFTNLEVSNNSVSIEPDNNQKFDAFSIEKTFNQNYLSYRILAKKGQVFFLESFINSPPGSSNFGSSVLKMKLDKDKLSLVNDSPLSEIKGYGLYDLTSTILADDNVIFIEERATPQELIMTVSRENTSLENNNELVGCRGCDVASKLYKYDLEKENIEFLGINLYGDDLSPLNDSVVSKKSQCFNLVYKKSFSDRALEYPPVSSPDLYQYKHMLYDEHIKQFKKDYNDCLVK